MSTLIFSVGMMSDYFAILKNLVAFPSISTQSNLDLIDYIEHYLSAYDVVCTRLPNPDGNKASLVVRIGAQAAGGLIFSGHSDVVPVLGQPWSSDPFTLRDAGDKLYGRGSCDMKGFLACVLACVPHWASLPLDKPIYLAISYDEEVGCLAAAEIADYLIKQGAQQALAIVGEPSMMQPIVAQKGITNICTTIKGKAAHSSQVGQGVSAIHHAARLINFIEQTMQALQQAGQIDKAFAVPFSSLHVGTISGGTASNIVAQDCNFKWEIRHLPDASFAEIMAQVDAYSAQLMQDNPQLIIDNQATIETVPALANEHNDDILALVRPHLVPNSRVSAVSYASEAGYFQQQGMQTIILGPGDIAQAHQADEWISKAQLQMCMRFVDSVVKQHCVKK